jgi:hypothetical protein
MRPYVCAHGKHESALILIEKCGFSCTGSLGTVKRSATGRIETAIKTASLYRKWTQFGIWY